MGFAFPFPRAPEEVGHMALDGFMELYRADDSKVEGEALDAKFAGTIALDSFEMKSEDAGNRSKPETGNNGQAGQGANNTGQTKGKAKYPVTFKVTKPVDNSSPALYLAYCLHSDQEDANDKPFKLVRVTLRKADSSRALSYLVIDFAEAFVTSYSLETDSEKLPSESVKFTCKKCCVSYRTQRLQGGGRDNFGGWDFGAGVKWEATKSG
jgi:type VI protein secretion system component Hcp